MASITLAAQYFGNEDRPFIIQPTVAGMSGETYKWSVGGTLIAGQTSRALTLPTPSLTASGNYTVTAINGGISYSASTRVDIIQALPENYQRGAGEGASLSIQAIPGATYQWVRAEWVEQVPSNLGGKTGTTNVYAAVSSTDYGVLQVRVSKNSVSALSNECYFTDYTPVTFDNGISETFTFPNAERTYTFLETSPDGRFVFIDDASPRTLWVTAPGFADQTSFTKNIQLYELPKPTIKTSAVSTASFLPQLRAYYGIFGGTSSSNANYYFMDEFRSYTDDGKYLAVVCNGQYAVRIEGAIQTYTTNFVVVYKLEGTTIAVTQTLFNCPYSIAYGGYIINQATTISSTTPPVTVSFSGNGTYLGIMYGSSYADTGNTFRVYKKNIGDTWGTVVVSKTSGDSLSNVTHTFLVSPRTSGADTLLYAGRFNGDGSFLSLCSLSASSIHTLSQPQNYFIYTINTATDNISRNTALEAKLFTELRKITNTTTYHRDDNITLPILFYFPRDDTTKLIGYNNVLSTSQVEYKNNIFVFSYSASTQTPSLVYDYNFSFFPGNNGSASLNPSQAFFQISDDGTYLLNTWNQSAGVTNGSTKRIFKIPSYYHNKVNPTTGEISDANERAYVQYVHLFETSNIEANRSYNGYIHGNKFILFNPDNTNYRMVVKTITPRMENVKPAIADTSAKIYVDQDECSVGSELTIRNFLSNTTFFGTPPKGILLRIKNNRDAVGNQVAYWKMKSDYATNSTFVDFSNTYTSTDEDKWYIFYSDDNTTIRLDMAADRFFNNTVYPNNKITLEYKLWSGFGWNNPGFDSAIYTKNSATPKNAYTINGSLVTIADIYKSPFSNETGQLQIFIKNIINTPDPFGHIYAPLTTTGVGSLFDNTSHSYVYSMDVLKNSLASKPFSLRDILHIFRPTMSTNYPVNPTNPYSAENYRGGIGIFVKNQYSLQISVDNGNTWYFLVSSTNPANLAYFFNLGVRNYLFRYARQGDSIMNLMNSLNVYIFPWNGVEISIGTDTLIKEFSSTNYTINAANEIILTNPTKVAANEIQDADSPNFPERGCYVTGDSNRLLITSGLWANNVENAKPQFKNTSNRVYALKMVDATGTVVNAYTHDTTTTTNSYSFTPNDIFYGSGGQAITLHPGVSANDTCDVYDPNIADDEQLLGLILPRDASVFSINGKWQYTINNGSSWADLYESASSSNVIRFWSNRKYDTRIRLRFLPNIVKKTTSVSLPFYLYDGADFIPYAYDNNYESAAYQLNGTQFGVSISNGNSAMRTGRSDVMGSLTLNVVHMNTAPVLNSGTYTPLVSSPYAYNSQKDISFNNIYPINKHIETITYQTSYTNQERTTFNTTASYTTRKNALRINVATIVNSTAISDPVDSTDSAQVALYSGDFTNACVKVYYTDGAVETLAQGGISKSNAVLIPNYIGGSPSTYSNFYNLLGQSFMNVNNVKGWIRPMLDASYVSRLELSGNEIIRIRDSINTASDYYTLQPHVFDIATPCAYPTLVPNSIHGLPVMRFERSKSTLAIPLFEQNGQNNQVLLKNTILIVERPRAVDASGFNALIGDSANNFFFGYTASNTITLTFNNRGTPKTISYSDSTIEIDSEKTHAPRVWTIFTGGSSDNVQININGKMVAQLTDTSKPSMFLDNPTPRLGGYISWNGANHHYEGDVCDVVSLAGLTLGQVKMFEDYLIHTWVNPQIYVEPRQNLNVDLSYSFYIWDGSNTKNLTTNYANVQTRGGNTPYSVNSGTFTIKVKKANSRPAISMGASVATNSAILPALPLIRSFGPEPISTLSFRLGTMDMSIQNHDFTLLSLFDDIIKNCYMDEDINSSLSDSKGIAITHIDTTLGIWSVVKTDGTVESLGDISVNNAYLIKRDTSGNCLRLTLRTSVDPAANRFQTPTMNGLPGTTCFQAIAWDSTDPSYSEYSKVDLDIVANPDDVENSFSIVADGVFEFCATTRPYIAGKTSQTLFVYNADERNSTFIPMNLIGQFTTSQITDGTKRIDIYNIDNLDSAVILQYMCGSTWKDIVLPLSSPINGNYPIRVKESTAFRAINTTFSCLMALYDSGTGLYSPNFGSISVQVQEANLPPSIRTNPTAISRPRITSITSSTITYEPVFNDIENRLDGELPPLFDFKIYTSFNSTSNIKPIIWADRNIGSNLKLNSFAIQIIETLNGRLYYADDNGEFMNVVVNKASDRFLLSSSNTLKYIPTYGNSGKAILRIYAWDGVLGTVGTRTEVDASGAYTCGAFSNDYITLEFPVIPRNNAPSFITDNKLYSAAVQQTDTNADISGVSVKSIMADTIGFDYVELNSVNSLGLAVIDASGGGLGVWQASINGGASWSNVATGLHLLADEGSANRIRYMFDTSRNTYSQSYSVIPTLCVVAWDKTNTVANGAVNPVIMGANGGSSPYSAESVRLGANILHRNHAPIISAGSTIFNIGAVHANSMIDISFQTILSAIGAGVMSDPDIGEDLGIKIVDVSFNNIPSVGAQMGTWSYTDSILNGIYTVIRPNSPAELLPSRNPVLRFQADKYVYGSTQLTFRAFDGELESAGTRTLRLNINDINYAPTITNVSDISYNVIVDVSRTILVSSIIQALGPTDLNIGTSYGIVLSAASFDANVALVQYSINPSATVPVYNTLTNSLIGNGSTALHLPSNAALRYTAKLNRPIQIALDVTLWDRSNNSAVVAAAGYAVPVPVTRNEFSPYSASTVKLVFHHDQVNYAPTIAAGTTLLETVNGLATSSTYTVPSILAQIAYADPNNGNGRGIAVIGMDICGGHYEYTIDGGSSWIPMPTGLGSLRALHLSSARTTNAIRYVSSRNTTDYSTLTVVGWDQMNAPTDGAVATLPSIRGGNTPYSSNDATLRLEQTHVNSRPILSAGTVRSTTPVNYSTGDYIWHQFSDYVPISTAFSDADYSLVKRDGVPQVTDKTYGILITAVDVSAGTWFVSSDRRTVTDITSISADAAAIVAPSDYFALRTSKNIDISFNMTYKAWDKSRHTTTTTVDTTDTTNTSYSVTSGIIVVPVKHVNTPPILDAAASGFQAPTIQGDGSDNLDSSGVSVARIIGDLITRGVYVDVDNSLWGYAAEPTGIVILGSTLNTTTGAWEYSINGGISWSALPLNGGGYLHLSYSASNWIRFQPSINATGSASLRIAAWNQTNGLTNGAVQEVTSAQRTGALGQSYSVNETVAVFPTVFMNHAPVFGNSTYTLPIVEYGNINNGKDWASIFTGLAYTDKNGQDARGIVVDSIVVPDGLTGSFQVLRDASWNTVTTGLQFTLPTYSSLRFLPAENIEADILNASIVIRPYDGITIGNTSVSVIAPVKKTLFSPTFTVTLATNLIPYFRADNKLSAFGGVSQGVSMTKLLNDMGFTDLNVSNTRGIAIQALSMKGITGYFEVKLGNASWSRIPTITINNFYHVAEFTDSSVNRIRFFSTSPADTGSANIIFYGWNPGSAPQSDSIPSGTLKRYTTAPLSFTAYNGVYIINIQQIVGK